MTALKNYSFHLLEAEKVLQDVASNILLKN